MSISKTSTTGRPAAIGIAAAGVLMGVGGVAHPRVDTSVEFEAGLAGMFESSVWNASHALILAGYLVLAISLAVLVRALGSDWSPRLRAVAWVAVAAAGFAVVESLPHLLASSEAGAMRRGEATPLADLHSTLQVISTPAFGLSVATLAIVGARTRTFDGGRVATALAVIGGLAVAAAGPAIAFTENSALSPLFAGSAGIALWAVVAGVRTARRLGRAPAGGLPAPELAAAR